MLLLALLLLAPVLARAQALDSLTLRWTAPSDPPGGPVSLYDARLSTTAITPDDFEQGTRIPTSAPRPPGAVETLVVRGLVPGQPYWFAIRSCDAAGNWSALSNVVRWTGPLDASPPAAPTGLAASATDGGQQVQLTWSENAEPGLRGYLVYRATDPAGPWTGLTAAPIATPGYLDAGPPASATRAWYEVSAVDADGHESPRSAAVAVVLGTPLAGSPTAWRVLAPFPNPAAAGATMRIGVEVPIGAGSARLEIVDGANRVVRRFDLRPATSGLVVLAWDGRNDRGAPCAPGVYRACLLAGVVRQSVRVARVP